MRQLELLFSRGQKPFTFADDESRKAFRDRYEEPLLVQRELLRPTLPEARTANERAPLVFSAGDVNGHPHFLVLRDVAGEDLERPRPDSLTLGGADGTDQAFESARFDFFRHADGIVFLIDPMRVEGIRQLLMGQVMERQLGGDPVAVLDRVMAKVNSSPSSHRPRLCLTLSKFDVLELLYQVEGTEWAEIMGNRGAAFLRDPSLTQFTYDDADGRLLRVEALSLLERLNAQPLANLVIGSRIPNRLFVVSALGQHGDAGVGRLNDRGISPFRVVDPLKWLLATAGVLPAVGVPPQ